MCDIHTQRPGAPAGCCAPLLADRGKSFQTSYAGSIPVAASILLAWSTSGF